jgi:hypothetical protein
VFKYFFEISAHSVILVSWVEILMANFGSFFSVKHVVVFINYAMSYRLSTNNNMFSFISLDIFCPFVYFSLQSVF